jgi:hypothetical protein
VAGGTSGGFWSTGGNSVSSGDFIGSVNSQALVFKTNSNARMVITTGGYVGIGASSNTFPSRFCVGNDPIQSTGGMGSAQFRIDDEAQPSINTFYGDILTTYRIVPTFKVNKDGEITIQKVNSALTGEDITFSVSKDGNVVAGTTSSGSITVPKLCATCTSGDIVMVAVDHTGKLIQADAQDDYQLPITFGSGLKETYNSTTNDYTVENKLTVGDGSAQTIYGATTAGGSLTIESTVNATKGDVIFTGPLKINTSSVPGIVTDRLYNVSGTLYWNGAPINSSFTSVANGLTVNSSVLELGGTLTRNTDVNTTNGATNYNLNLTGSGKIGIGTNSPFAKLHITGGALLLNGTTGGTPTDGSGNQLGTGIRLMWIPSKGAFRAGYASGTSWDDANIGQYSNAIGYDTKASGVNSTALGFGAQATGTRSLALMGG